MRQYLTVRAPKLLLKRRTVHRLNFEGDRDLNDQPSSWEIDIPRIVRLISNRKDIFFSTLAGILFFTVIILHVVPRSYEVNVAIAPVAQNSNRQIGGGLSGGLGALAQLGGVNLSDLTGGGGQFALFVKSITSPNVANSLSRDQDLMKSLFPRDWSQAEHRWREPTGILHIASRTVQGLLGIPIRRWSPPNGEDVLGILKKDIEVDDDPKSPIVTLRIQSPHPEMAVRMLNELIQTIDAQLRARALQRANDYIAYLTRQLETVSVAEYRQALMTRLSEQEQIRMMASAKVSFAAQLFSGPAVSSEASAPKSIMILILSAVFGAILGGFLAIRAQRHLTPSPRSQGGAAQSLVKPKAHSREATEPRS